MKSKISDFKKSLVVVSLFDGDMLQKASDVFWSKEIEMMEKGFKNHKNEGTYGEHNVFPTMFLRIAGIVYHGQSNVSTGLHMYGYQGMFGNIPAHPLRAAPLYFPDNPCMYLRTLRQMVHSPPRKVERSLDDAQAAQLTTVLVTLPIG